MNDPRFTRIREEWTEQDPPPPPRRRGRRLLGMTAIVLLLLVAVLPAGHELTRLLFRGQPQQSVRPGQKITGPPTKPARHIQVNVLNACGVNGLGARMTAFLREQGIDVSECATVRTRQPYSAVIDRMGDSGTAGDLARKLGIHQANVRSEPDSAMFLQCTIVIGDDYQSLIPFGR